MDIEEQSTEELETQVTSAMTACREAKTQEDIESALDTIKGASARLLIRDSNSKTANEAFSFLECLRHVAAMPVDLGSGGFAPMFKPKVTRDLPSSMRTGRDDLDTTLERIWTPLHDSYQLQDWNERRVSLDLTAHRLSTDSATSWALPRTLKDRRKWLNEGEVKLLLTHWTNEDRTLNEKFITGSLSKLPDPAKAREELSAWLASPDKLFWTEEQLDDPLPSDAA